MKNQRTLLIEQAARYDADDGTEWRDRTEAWFMTNENRAPLNSITLKPEFCDAVEARLDRAMSMPLTLPRFFI